MDGQPVMAQFEPAQLEPPVMAYYDQQANLARAAKQGIRNWLEQKPYIPLLKAMIWDAFQSECPLQLSRFESLLTAILEGWPGRSN